MKEHEIVRHTATDQIEIFINSISERCPHGHSDLEFGIILDGTVNLFIESDTITLNKNDIYVINRFNVHSFKTVTPTNHVLIFQVYAGLFNRISNGSKGIIFPTKITPNKMEYESLLEILEECYQIYFNEKDKYGFKISSLVLDALHILSQCKETKIISETEQERLSLSSSRMNRISDYMEKHFTENISLQSIAESENVSVFYLSHYIKEVLGISFQDYLENMRFEKALSLISNPSHTLLSICVASGFSGTRYLNKAFMKRFGIGAKRYRELEKKPIPTTSLPSSNIEHRYSFLSAKNYLESQMLL